MLIGSVWLIAGSFVLRCARVMQLNAVKYLTHRLIDV